MAKTFYIETFGCQINVVDSEKVAGTLLRSGLRQSSRMKFASEHRYWARGVGGWRRIGSGRFKRATPGGCAA